MKKAQHERVIRRHYVPLLAAHGPSFRAVDWGSSRSQALRFRVLLEGVGSPRGSLLDVGCGVGHLAGHLAKRGPVAGYLGIDALPEMVTKAKRRFPGRRFEVGDILDASVAWRADHVLASGIFTFADERLMRRSIVAMYAACRRAVAFNALSAWATRGKSGEFRADPLATLEFCRRLTPKVTLRHDYLPHDFTVYLYR